MCLGSGLALLNHKVQLDAYKIEDKVYAQVFEKAARAIDNP
jgi:hypothetical protein